MHKPEPPHQMVAQDSVTRWSHAHGLYTGPHRPHNRSLDLPAMILTVCIPVGR